MRIGNETGLMLVTLSMPGLPTVHFTSQILHTVRDKNWSVGTPGAKYLITLSIMGVFFLQKSVMTSQKRKCVNFMLNYC